MRQRKLSALTLIDSLATFGGAERVAAKVTAGLDPERFERFICMTRARPEPTFRSELQEAGVRVLSLDRRSPLDVMHWRPLVELLRNQPIDILHAHKFGSNAWGSVLGRVVGVPVVIAHEHVWSFEGQRLRRFVDRSVIARNADVILAVSNETRRQMITVEGVAASPIHVLPNGIPPLPRPSGDGLRAELAIPTDAPVIGTLSQLRPQKALEILVSASVPLALRFPDLAVLIAGRGSEEQRLRSLIREHGLEGTVFLLGPRRDVPEILDALDLAICCSRYEGMPLSVMEYMAASKPVVATAVGGVPDLIDDGVHGLLIPPEDPHRLADAIAELLSDPDRAAEMGRRGNERQRREFDLSTMVRRLEELYIELYRASGAGRRESLLLNVSAP
jgi:glycosyltransferase involved in cell wall biosynthesis